MPSLNKKIGIFGGTFQPPHRGHERALQAFLREVQPDLCYVIPCGILPHKKLEESAGAHHRLEMARLAFSPLSDRVIVSDMEVAQNEVSYTFQTLARIRRMHPEASLYLFVGMDQFLIFETWKNVSQILSEVTLCVMERGGAETAFRQKKIALEEEFGARLLLLKEKAYIISSSQIREELKEEGITRHVSPSVYEYLTKNGLYGCRRDPVRHRILGLLETSLSPKRFSHTLSVERETARLCDLLACPGKRELCLAALLHDRTKEWSIERQCSFLEERGAITEEDRNSPAVLHGISAAILSREEGLISSEGERAIRYHTTGRRGMSLGEKILYFADYIEEKRPHPSCRRMRALFYAALPENKEERLLHFDALVKQVMWDTLSHLKETNGPVHPLTRQAIEDREERNCNDSH